MPAGINIPLTDSRVSPLMRAYLLKKGFRLKEYFGHLFVIGEEGGEPVELGYKLFCTLARIYYADELEEIGGDDYGEWH